VARSPDLDALIARAQGGDARAFEELIAGQLGQVRRFARAFAASEPDADDLAQEALIKAYRSLRLFRYQAAFSTWLFTVVRSVYLDFAKSRAGRERAREAPLEAGADEAADETPADELLEREHERLRVWRALREVPVEYRAALVLFDIEGRTYDEVAAIESVPVGTVKSRLARGRAHLKRLLDAAPADGGGDAGTGGGSPSSNYRRSGS